MIGYWVVFYFLACGEFLVRVNTAETTYETCSKDRVCEFNALCTLDEDGHTFCACPEGLSGDFCKVVDECQAGGKYEACVETVGNCTFNNEKAVCYCGPTKEFDIKTGKCRVVCGANVCQNGALKCNEEKKCDCQVGWTGEDCSQVEGCTGNLQTICENLSLECIYYRDQSKAVCKCTGENEIFNGTHCIDPCFINPCKNDGVCIIVNSTDYICECKQPYSGNHCERHPCHSNPCLNDGACIAVENTYGCVCDEPFYGKHCENDPCTSNPCRNEGSCGVVGIDFDCTCKVPYFGKQCENEIDTTDADHTTTEYFTTGLTTNNNEFNTTDEKYATTDYFSREITTNIGECDCGDNSISCHLNWKAKKLCSCKDGFDQRRGTETCSRTCQSSADCRNGGICDRDGPGYFCMCPEPYIGDRCEVDVCSSMWYECGSMGANCVRQGTTGMCECPKGKTMSRYNYCQDICTSETCIHGVCKLTDSIYLCICYEGYYGKHCENTEPTVYQYGPFGGILVILGFCIVLFSIASIIAGCWVKKLRKKIEEKAKHNLQP